MLLWHGYLIVLITSRPRLILEMRTSGSCLLKFFENFITLVVLVIFIFIFEFSASLTSIPSQEEM